MENIRLVTQSLDIHNCFQAIVTGRDVAEGKPSPQGFLLAAKKLGIPPGECIAIEDSKNGVISAKDAGMFCIGYDGGFHKNQDISRADMKVKSFKEIDLGELCKR